MTDQTPTPETPPNLDDLAARLKALREEAKVSQTAAAEHIGTSQNRISRSEKGQGLLEPTAVRKLVRLYNGSNETAEELARWAEALRPARLDSRLIFQRGTNHFQERVSRMEEASARVRSYQPGMVIGVVQTPVYASTVTGQRANPAAAAAARTRRERHQRLLDNEDRQWTLIQTEGSLRWPLNSPAVMIEQLEHLVAISRRPNVRLGIVAQNQPVMFTAPHGFHIYDEQAVQIGTKTANALTSDARDLRDYLTLFGRLEGAARWGDEAREVIAGVTEEYRRMRPP